MTDMSFTHYAPEGNHSDSVLQDTPWSRNSPGGWVGNKNFPYDATAPWTGKAHRVHGVTCHLKTRGKNNHEKPCAKLMSVSSLKIKVERFAPVYRQGSVYHRRKYLQRVDVFLLHWQKTFD